MNNQGNELSELISFVHNNLSVINDFSFSRTGMEIGEIIGGTKDCSIDLSQDEEGPYLTITLGNDIVNIKIDLEEIQTIDERFIPLLEVYKKYLDEILITVMNE